MAGANPPRQLREELAGGWNRLGCSLLEKRRFSDAIACYRRAVAIRPEYAEAHSNLGMVLRDAGRIDEAIAAHRQALALKPDSAEIHSSLLFTLHFQPHSDPPGIYEEHRQFDRQHAAVLPRLESPAPPAVAMPRRLRVGYLSPDLRDHVVAVFFQGLLIAHGRAEVEVFCYADVPHPDAVTVRLRAHSEHWVDVAAMSDEQIARQIAGDRIDILVDLAGHTARNRLLVFARKPAPVQVAYLGYPCTTGLSAMDYRMTDSLADPPGRADELSAEHLVRLDPCAWCYAAPANAPLVAAPSADERAVTFGTFNALAKVNEEVLSTWAEILQRTPRSRLLMKSMQLGDDENCKRILHAFANRGIDPARIDLLPYIDDPMAQLAAYHRLDVALDTFPYAGTTTTCEALWMGVPVVTLAGPAHAGRVGVSLLSNVGLPELIAPTGQEYVQIAVDLANDLPRRSELRASLRERMRNSALMNSHRLARAVESAYRAMWKQSVAARNDFSATGRSDGII